MSDSLQKAVNAPSTKPAIVVRGGWDRIRYALIFEGILIVLFGAAMSLVTGHDMLDTGGLAVVLSILALVTNLVYNYVYDRVDVAFGRVPTERSRTGRVVHAIGFELTLIVLGLPLMMWWLDLNFWQALALDVATMVFVVIYTYFFTLAYDRILPVAQPVHFQGSE